MEDKRRERMKEKMKKCKDGRKDFSPTQCFRTLKSAK